MAFESPARELNMASEAATTALEASCARVDFAHMFTPPQFSSPARSRAGLFRLTHTGPYRVAARPERTPLPDGAPDSPTDSPREQAGRLPADSDRPASPISHTSRRPRRSIGPSRCALRLPRRRWPTPTISIDRGSAAAMCAGQISTQRRNNDDSLS